MHCDPSPSPQSLQAEIAYSVVDPAAGVPPGLSTFPQPVAWPDHGNNNTCNSYLPQDSTLNRFVWVVNYLAHNGFYVIIDDHSEDPTVADSKTEFVTKWVDIVTRLSQDPVTREHLIVDILNEPDGRGWGWDVMGVSLFDSAHLGYNIPYNIWVIFKSIVSPRAECVHTFRSPLDKLLQPLYLDVMDAVYPVNDKVLFFVEGCGQGTLNGANW